MHTMMNEKTQILTVGEAARYLNRSASAVRKYEAQGRISAMRSERGYRFYFLEELERLRAELAR